MLDLPTKQERVWGAMSGCAVLALLVGSGVAVGMWWCP